MSWPVPSEHQPQAAVERQVCARHLVQRPLTCKEHDPDVFTLIRRHEAELDRWFTQRLGYRLVVNADTARLFKDGFVAERRPLVTVTHRAFRCLEYVLLALVLGATVAGPNVISLRELVERVRSAAVEVDIALDNSPSTRRAMVCVLQWMISLGLAAELHERVDAYVGDEAADAILKIRPERIALLPLPALAGAASAQDLLAHSERRMATRQWMRSRLVEDPVLYRSDLSDAEWSELRRRLGEEERLLDEMFGLTVEARAEGVAAIDPAGTLAATRFPSGGTVGHAALLLIARLRDEATRSGDWHGIVRFIGELAVAHRRRWAGEFVDAPERLAHRAVDVLIELRLAEWATSGDAEPATARVDGAAEQTGPGAGDTQVFRLLPAAARYFPVTGPEGPVTAPEGPGTAPEDPVPGTESDPGQQQGSFW